MGPGAGPNQNLWFEGDHAAVPNEITPDEDEDEDDHLVTCGVVNEDEEPTPLTNLGQLQNALPDIPGNAATEASE